MINETLEEYFKIINDARPGEWQIIPGISIFLGRSKKLTLFCTKGKHEVTKSVARNFINYGCNCKGPMQTLENFLVKVNKKWNNEWELSETSVYLGSDKPLTLRHIPCETDISKTRATAFVQARCPICKGQRVSETLKNKTQEEKDIINEKKKKTFRKKYNADSPMQNEEIKNKCRNTWANKTKDEIKEITDKRVATNQKRYNKDSPSQVEEFKLKTKKTFLDHYGVDNPMKVQEIKEKQRQSTHKKYSVYNIKQIHLPASSIEIISDKTKFQQFCKDNKHLSAKELADKLGYLNWTAFYNKLHEFDAWDLVNHTIKTSSEEKEIILFLKELDDDIKIIQNDRTILDGQEIDILLPDFNIGIEYCGFYWHASNPTAARTHPKSTSYHFDKMVKASEKGIYLIQIFEDEWKTQKELVKDKIKSKLGFLNLEKIYARKCNVKIFTSKRDKREMAKFISKYHIQGHFKSSVILGLYFEKKLVACMSFLILNKENMKEWKLDRFCTINDKLIVGAAGKLLSTFIKNFNPNSIITFSDNRWTNINKNLYTTIGFTQLDIGSPGYFYIKPGEYIKYSRQQFQKRKLGKFEQFDINKTELENMESFGYLTLYDAGQSKYELKIEQ